MSRPEPNVYSPRTLAHEWGCSERHIRNLINEGQLRAWRAGGKLLRIDPKDVEEYKCRNTVLDASVESLPQSTMTQPENVTAIRLARITRRPR
ncbi:MAG: helix-turn-helix domain-containing protein [Mesorhizobium sp.]|nr:MAG: helix-turn-helix domain-containing protein [Mesorhizobium sp.]